MCAGAPGGSGSSSRRATRAETPSLWAVPTGAFYRQPTVTPPRYSVVLCAKPPRWCTGRGGSNRACSAAITFAGHAEAARHVAGRARLRRTAWSRCRCAAVAQQRREGAVAMRMHDASLLGARHGRGVVYPMRAGCGGAVEAGGRQWCGMRVCMCCALYCCVSRKYSLRGRGGFLPFFLALQGE